MPETVLTNDFILMWIVSIPTRISTIHKTEAFVLKVKWWTVITFKFKFHNDINIIQTKKNLTKTIIFYLYFQSSYQACFDTFELGHLVIIKIKAVRALKWRFNLRIVIFPKNINIYYVAIMIKLAWLK